MAITRDSRHKRRNTGGRRNVHKKKRKYETGRQPAMTKLVINQPGRALRVRKVRTRGGNLKFRALRLDSGNFSWGSEVCTRKTRILDVVYNASNNELVRTKTLVKNAIVSIDATPFRQWYKSHYGVALGKKAADDEEVAQSRSVQAKRAARQKGRVLDSKVGDQFSTGRLLACISSRPGQSGRADGYILEGKELEFYQRQLAKKKGKKNQ